MAPSDTSWGQWDSDDSDDEMASPPYVKNTFINWEPKGFIPLVDKLQRSKSAPTPSTSTILSREYTDETREEESDGSQEDSDESQEEPAQEEVLEEEGSQDFPESHQEENSGFACETPEMSGLLPNFHVEASSDVPAPNPAGSLPSGEAWLQEGCQTCAPSLPFSSFDNVQPGELSGGYTSDSSGGPPGVLHATPQRHSASRLASASPDDVQVEEMLSTLQRRGVNIVVVDTVARCKEVCSFLLGGSQLGEVAVDLEGKQLSRMGEIDIVQIGVRSGDAFLFDISTLGSQAFDNGLQQLLESDRITKLLFDCRMDADALHHLYRVNLRNFLDVQILHHTSDHSHHKYDIEYMKGLDKVLQRLARKKLLTPEELELALQVKKAGRRLYDPEQKHGGSFEIWKQRPLHPILQMYCAVDVGHLFKILDQWSCELPRHVLHLASAQRAFNQVTGDCIRHDAEKDFQIPEVTADSSRMSLSQMHLTLLQLCHQRAAQEEYCRLTQESAIRDVLGLPLRQVDSSQARATSVHVDVPSASLAPPTPARDLTRSVDPATGVLVINWSSPASELRTSNQHCTSPAFEIDFHGCRKEFKLLLIPFKNPSETGRGAGSWRKSQGRATMILKCISDLEGLPDAYLTFRFFMGEQRVYKGTIAHDFQAGACARLAEDEIWNLGASVVDGKLVVGVEVLPQLQ
jgi:exonuclease 3'-5' domain-containing protein 1